jgi:hypothetical protein
MAKTATGGFADDMDKWLAVAGLLISLGVLPKNWQKGVGAAAALVWLYRRL